MNSDTKKVGVISSWNSQRAFGVIRCGPAGSLERYFLHISKIISGTAAPEPGMTCRFVVNPDPVKPGQLLQALSVEIDVHSVSAKVSDGGVL